MNAAHLHDALISHLAHIAGMLAFARLALSQITTTDTDGIAEALKAAEQALVNAQSTIQNSGMEGGVA